MNETLKEMLEQLEKLLSLTENMDMTTEERKEWQEISALVADLREKNEKPDWL